MFALMTYEEVAYHLRLDPRGERRDRLLLESISEELLLYLGRDLHYATTENELTESDEEGNFYLEHYPVREIISIIDTKTNNTLQLYEYSPIPRLESLLSLVRVCYQTQIARNWNLRVTYTHGYELSEIPPVIKMCLLCRLKDEIENPLDSNDKKYLHYAAIERLRDKKNI